MESVYHIKTREYFDVPEDDFDKFQNIFGKYEPRSEEDALSEVEIAEETFSRIYTDDEIKSIFWLDAEYSGTDKLIAKDNVAELPDRRKAEDELKAYIKAPANKRKTLSLKSAKTLLKVMESFESYECTID